MAAIARQGDHLRAVDGGDAEGFVVGLEGADALALQQGAMSPRMSKNPATGEPG